MMALVVLVCVLASAIDAGQLSAPLSGRVTDAANAPLPGVQVTVTQDGKTDRTTVTGADGRYTLPGLPVGRYKIKAELAGFDTATKENVGVEAGSINDVSFVLQTACLSQIDFIDLGFSATSRHEATAILQIRIVSEQVHDRCPIKLYCTCTDYVAFVERVLKAGKTDVSARRISLLHVPADPFSATGRSAQSPYWPGQEYIAVLHWYQPLSRFMAWRNMYVFPVHDGRVDFRRTDAPGITDGMTVDEFAIALRAFAKQ